MNYKEIERHRRKYLHHHRRQLRTEQALTVILIATLVFVLAGLALVVAI